MGFGPGSALADQVHRSKPAFLFDHLVDTCEECWRHREAKCFRRLQIDQEFDPGYPLDR
jgi:hypothetical protein